jgi:hypothetical protein
MGRVCTRAAEPTERYTYGFRSASILAALVNAAILLIVTGAIVWEAVRRFAEPPVVVAPTVMVVAAIAIAVNLASAWLLQGGEHDLNIRGAFMHLDDRFHESCHKRGIHLSSQTPISAVGGLETKDEKEWQRGGGRLKCRLEMRTSRT